MVTSPRRARAAGSEPVRVGIAVVAGHQEVLRTCRLERDEQTGFVATHGQPVRNVLGKRRVRPGFHVDPLVADECGDRSVEDVQRLVFARVGVDRRLVAGAQMPLHDGPVATGLLTGKFELGARAAALGDCAPGAGPSEDGLGKGHTFPFLVIRERTGCTVLRISQRTPIEPPGRARFAIVRDRFEIANPTRIA